MNRPSPTPKPPIILGLAGRKKSGKTTVGEYLYQHWGFQLMAFAAPLKAKVWTLFQVSTNVLHGHPDLRDRTEVPLRSQSFYESVLRRADHHLSADLSTPLPVDDFKTALAAWRNRMLLEGRDPTVRETLQWFGTDWAQPHDQLVWTTPTIQQALAELQTSPVHKAWTGRPVAITDVRFVHEAKAIIAAGGKVWWMEPEDRLPPKQTSQDHHSSEPDRERFKGMISFDVRTSEPITETPDRVKAALLLDLGVQP